MIKNNLINMNNIDQLNWEKSGSLIPTIIQDLKTRNVLMLGWSSKESLQKTLETNQITFFSRSRNKLWTKGETSGNFMKLNKIFSDCDNDTLLIMATPSQTVCHLGHKNCFQQETFTDHSIIENIETIIDNRMNDSQPTSYINKLLNKGIKKIAQKVGEEGVEVAIAGSDPNDKTVLEESADLIFHLLVLIRSRGYRYSDILNILSTRNV